MRHTTLIPLTLLVLLLAACQAVTPPRLATATARAAETPTPTPEPVMLPAPTPTLAADSEQLPDTPIQTDPNPSITVWVNETSDEHEAVLQEMADTFTAQSQIDVEMVLVSPQLLPDLVNTAVLSDTLPDVILHPFEYSDGWAERGILDPAAADAAIDQIGRDTFDQDALALVNLNGQTAVIPSDGTYQLILYRTDWFAEQNLAPPDNYDAMFTAAETTTDRENLHSGFVIPTESNLVTTQFAFEQIAHANGCDLIDAKGEVTIQSEACTAALDFYFRIVNQFSPIGVQTDTSTRNAYLNGRTGLIITSPDILPMLAGLDPDHLPDCPECKNDPAYLLENTGILTQLTGSGPQATAAGLGRIRALGITSVADTEAAIAFADYWFNEGYPLWLSVEPERKVPMRLGTTENPGQFIDAWTKTPLGPNQPGLADLLAADTVAQLEEGIAQTPRWGFKQGQGSLMAEVLEELIFPVVLQEMLSGYFPANQTIIELYDRVTELIPNYAYYPEPTATPDES